MDYIERERRRLEIDLYVLTRRWHGTLSRMFVLRGRLDGIDPTDVEAFSRTANTLGAFANDATSLKRDVDKVRRRFASFDVDAQRRANADVDGSCRYLTIDGGRCGGPTVKGSRWCGRHVGLWSDNMTMGTTMSAYVPYMREAATGVCAVSAVAAAIPVWFYAESSGVGDA